jgi:hypothetical protein
VGSPSATRATRRPRRRPPARRRWTDRPCVWLGAVTRRGRVVCVQSGDSKTDKLNV